MKPTTYLRIVCLVLILSNFPNTHAQDQELDSLYLLWKNETLPDSTRADALLDFAYEGYFFPKPDSAKILFEQAYEFSKKANYKLGMIDALNLSGYNSFRMGNYPDALKKYDEGIQLAEEENDISGTAMMLMRTGFVYHDNEDLVKAIEYYEEALELFEKEANINGVGNIYNEFGSIYFAKGDYKKSLEYYEKCIAINKQDGDVLGDAAIYGNIGRVYLELEDFDKALENTKKSLELDSDANNKLGIASGLATLGDIYSEQNKDTEALDYLEKSAVISQQIKDIQGLCGTLLSLSNIYLNLENNQKAIAYCKRTLELAKTTGDLGSQEDACDCLYDAYKSIGNQNQSMFYLEQMLSISDSIKSEDTLLKMQQMEFAKQVLADSLQQIEKEIKVTLAHEQEVRKKDRNRNIAIAVGIIFLFLSIGLFSRWRYIKKAKAVIEIEKDRSESLLLNILPSEIAEELKEKGEAAARDFDMVTILFSDFKGFTQKSEQLTAKELIDEINHCFKAFDQICENYGVEKIKTIGDAYMAAGGLPVPSDDAVIKTIFAAIEMQSFISERIKELKDQKEVAFEMRVGIHTGPVVAGIVGVKKFQYDIWGDTVNIASRMESNGEIGRINISQFTYELIKEDKRFEFESRGKVNVKGKGEMDMWFVNLKDT